MLDIVDPSRARESIERFALQLQIPHTAFQGAKPHHLTFRSLIVIPSLTYPASPIATISPAVLSDILNTRLLNPILTMQAFLPLFTSAPSGLSNKHSPNLTLDRSVLVLTPAIIPALSPAFHALESATVAALTSFTQVLSAEVAPLSIPVTHLQLGTFDFGAFAPRNQLQTVYSQRAEALGWEEGARQTYARNFVVMSSGSIGATKGCGSLGSPSRGSSLRELNNAVFDAMVCRKSGIVRVGMGSSIYGFVGRWVPRNLVAWMMGVTRSDSRASGTMTGHSSEHDSRATSPGSASAGVAAGLGESEYISVHEGKDADA